MASPEFGSAFGVPYEFYASQSGLSPRYSYTKSQHEWRFFRDRSGLSDFDSIGAHQRAVWRAGSGLTPVDAYTDQAHFEAYYNLTNFAATLKQDQLDQRTLENRATNPRFARAATGTTVVRRNLATRPQPSAGGQWGAGYGTGGVGTQEFIDDPRFGTGKAERVTFTTAPTGRSGLYLNHVPTVTVAAGEVYTLSMRYYSSWEGWTPYFYTPITHQIVSSGIIDHGDGTKTYWRQCGFTASGAVNLTLAVLSGPMPAVGDSWAAGDAQFEKVPGYLPFFSGYTSNDTGIAYSWEGTPNASPSVAKAAVVEVRRNYFTNPSFTDAGQWSAQRATFAQANGIATLTVSEVGYFPRLNGQQRSVTPGEKIAVSATIEAAGVHRIGIQYLNSSGAAMSNPGSPSDTLVQGSGIGTRIGFVATVPTGAVNAVTWLGAPDSAPIGSVFAFSKPMFERKAVLLPYFDGSTAPDADLTPAWTGTPNASASTLSGVSLSAITYGGTVVRSWTAPHARFISNTVVAANEAMFFGAGGFGNLAFMQPGKTYTVIATLTLKQALTETAANTFKVLIRWAGEVSGSANSNTVVPNVPGTYQIRVTGTIPATGVTSTMVQLNHYAPTNGGDTYWSDLAIIEGAYAGPYFDGNTLGALWTGIVHNSTSVIRPF